MIDGQSAQQECVVYLDWLSSDLETDAAYSIPFRPNLFRFRDAMDSRNNSSEFLSPDSTPVTSICSHSIGTLSALNTVLTDSATSAPIPSPSQRVISVYLYCRTCLYPTCVPGIRVVVYFPPYFVGLNMSD